MATTLYERLGRADGIRRLVDDVMAAHLSNPVIRARFEAIEDIDRAKEMAWAFFCAGSGGDETYAGREMREAHQGMNISDEEYRAACEDILGALEKNGLSATCQGDVNAILDQLKPEIVAH